VQLAVQNDREWRRLCDQVLGRPALAGDPRFATNTERVAHRDELHAEIEAALAAFPAEKALELLDAAQIANGRMNTVVNLLGHPQLADRWAEVDSPAGPLRALPSPISLGARASRSARSRPWASTRPPCWPSSGSLTPLSPRTSSLTAASTPAMRPGRGEERGDRGRGRRVRSE
jgi:crotonobetainyl-CoA:carnitine CoA-transferase CaiB-like acyl-CoA transferase